MSLYPNLLKLLIEKCKEYRSRNITTADFHYIISQAEQEVVALEEKDLRKFLMLTESEIDYIRVMNNEADFMCREPLKEIDSFEKIAPLTLKVEEECRKRLERQK